MMKQKIVNLTQKLKKKPGASAEAIEAAMAQLGVEPPDDYLAFLQSSNGCEGFMESGRYLMIDSVEQLVPCNEPYGIGDRGPGLVAFGSDGGMMLFAFDIRQSPTTIVEVDATCMDDGPVILCGGTFEQFLEYLAADSE